MARLVGAYGASTAVRCFYCLFLVYFAQPTFAFPVYVASNGTTVVNSAFGSDLVLSPDAGGACIGFQQAFMMALIACRSPQGG